MGFTGTGLSQSPQVANNNLIQQKLRAEAMLKGSASWFLWIAALSVVNSVIAFSGGSIRFIFGLGITQVVDGFAKAAGSGGPVLDLIINGFVAGIFVLFWRFAGKGQGWAFYVGMGLYLLDGLILLAFKDFLGAAFHAYVLYRMYGGLKALPLLREVEQALALTPSNAALEPK